MRGLFTTTVIVVVRSSSAALLATTAATAAVTATTALHLLRLLLRMLGHGRGRRAAGVHNAVGGDSVCMHRVATTASLPSPPLKPVAPPIPALCHRFLQLLLAATNGAVASHLFTPHSPLSLLELWVYSPEYTVVGLREGFGY